MNTPTPVGDPNAIMYWYYRTSYALQVQHIQQQQAALSLQMQGQFTPQPQNPPRSPCFPVTSNVPSAPTPVLNDVLAAVKPDQNPQRRSGTNNSKKGHGNGHANIRPATRPTSTSKPQQSWWCQACKVNVTYKDSDAHIAADLEKMSLASSSTATLTPKDTGNGEAGGKDMPRPKPQVQAAPVSMNKTILAPSKPKAKTKEMGKKNSSRSSAFSVPPRPIASPRPPDLPDSPGSRLSHPTENSNPLPPKQSISPPKLSVSSRPAPPSEHNTWCPFCGMNVPDSMSSPQYRIHLGNGHALPKYDLDT
ncbi:hypothetical protein DL93DRAFT_1734581 [Clavulina sp. PMI_390]|nr:hypothetical protein DL93DRAFT_1734581 [Clavulina sp. PMI_390]